MDRLLGAFATPGFPAIETHETAALVGSLGLQILIAVSACSKKAAMLSVQMNGDFRKAGGSGSNSGNARDGPNLFALRHSI